MAIPFLQAKHFTSVPTSAPRSIDLIVIHDMEWPETPTTAEGCAKMFHGDNSPEASDHYNVDADSEVQSVKDKDVAWCAPGANHNGLHFEHAGFARQSRAEWLDDYSKKMLTRSAKLTAAKAKQYGVPVRKLTAAEVRAGKRGFCGHYDVTLAFPERKGTHTDPGKGFPWDVYMTMVQAEYAALSGSKWTKSRLAKAAASLGVAIAVFLGISQTSDPVVKPTPTPTVTVKPAPSPTKVAPKPVVKPKPKPAPKVPAFPGTVHRGDRGKAVLAVQKRLKARGWSIVADGVFGPKTEAVVRAYQKNHRLVVDGIAGPLTWRSLWTAPIG